MVPVFVRLVWARFVSALLNVFTTRSTIEFERFTSAPLSSQGGDQSPAIVNVEPLQYQGAATASPAACEELFTRSIKDGQFDTAWNLLTPDSQASWRHPEVFRREMEARRPTDAMVGTRVREVRILPTWTDESTKKTYHEVAELIVDYRIRQRSRELVVTRDVHLVNVSGDWKSLCYRA